MAKVRCFSPCHGILLYPKAHQRVPKKPQSTHSGLDELFCLHLRGLDGGLEQGGDLSSWDGFYSSRPAPPLNKEVQPMKVQNVNAEEKICFGVLCMSEST